MRARSDVVSLYQDQLSLTERHLDSLVADANDTLALLTSLSESFQSVEEQTSTFQSKCEDLLRDQRRLEKLADEVGTDLYYYTYLDKATRRLNAPGASRLVDDDNFVDMIDDIQACVVFMTDHEGYRERDTYLARYSALLTKALHILDHGFSGHLDKCSAEVGKQIAAATSDSARHAIAYGRFAELMAQSYALLPNVHNIFRRLYDMYGRVKETATDRSVYVSSATNMLRSYLTTRDRDVKVLAQKDIEEYQKATKEKSFETASRNYIKQSFERIHSEDEVFVKMFGIEPAWNNAADSVFQVMKQIATTMAHPGYIAPIGNAIQTALQAAELSSICSVVGWLAHEYSIADSDEDEELAARKHREYAARLLVEHLWPFTDKAFEAEIAKSITKAAIQDSALKIDPVVDGVPSSNAHPVVKRAIELLSMFDQAMPKERSVSWSHDAVCHAC